MKYGSKRDYRKIDIYLDGKYQGSTTWSKTLKEAKKVYLNNNWKGKNDFIDHRRINAQFSDKN